MNITLLTKPGCARCFSAKAKLSILDLTYEEEDATQERIKSLGLTESDIPSFVIDGKGYTYPEAMAELKNRDSK